MQDNIPDALITAFERQYDSSWNDPQLRNERMAMRYGWAAAIEQKHCLHQIQEPATGLQQLIAEIDEHMRAEWNAGRLPAESWPASLASRVSAAASGSEAPVQAAPAAVAVPDAVIAGALFDFCGYLTTLPKESAITASGAHDASPMVDAIKAWSAKRSLELDDADVPGWRAALSVTPAADAPLPLLVRDIARELGITCAEACLALKPLGNFSTNTAVTAEMMAKLRERFPERVPASEVAGARERMTAGRACYFMERFLKEEKLLGPNEQAALHYVIDMLEAAAAPVVLPEPDDSEFEQQLPIQPIGVMGGGEARKVLWNCTFMPEAGTSFYTEQQVRALLATGGQAQADMPDSFREWFAQNYPADTIIVDPDWHAKSIFRMAQAHARLAAPQAQADARDAEIQQAVLAERERICAAIKAEDDHCVTEGDYMLDSDDCIKVARGEWVRPVYDAAIAAAKGQ